MTAALVISCLFLLAVACENEFGTEPQQYTGAPITVVDPDSIQDEEPPPPAYRKIHLPWPDTTAELLALVASGEVVAPEGLYATIHRDLELIRHGGWCNRFPRLYVLANYAFSPTLDEWPLSQLDVRLTPEAAALYKKGKFTAWDDLNEYYGIKAILGSPFAPQTFTLQFSPFLNPTHLVDPYSAIPGVAAVGPPHGLSPCCTEEFHIRMSQGSRHYSFFTYSRRSVELLHDPSFGDWVSPTEYTFLKIGYSGVELEGEFGYPAQEVFSMRRKEPIRGGCPDARRLLQAWVMRDQADRLVLTVRGFAGTWWEYGQIFTNAGQRQIVPLDHSQFAAIESLYTAALNVYRGTDPECNDCQEIALKLDSHILTANECAYALAPKFRQAVEALEDFLQELVVGEY